MKYQANPVIVDAFRIVETFQAAADGEFACKLEDGRWVHPTPAMMSRMSPVSGDYWVIQSDGYIYLNPKDVFERKYHPFVERPKATVEELEKILNSEDERPVRINDDGSITQL